MEKINNLVIITTPFHKLVVEKMFSNVFNESKTLVLYSKYVNIKNIKGQKRLLTDYNFSRNELFYRPFKNFRKVTFKLKKAKNEVGTLNKEFNFSSALNIIICSDKDIFTQLLLNNLFKNKSERKLIAIEEGLGFYLKTSFIDKLLFLTYKIFTPILFRARLYYVKRLGIYPKINTIYVRYLDLLPREIKSIDKYKKFRLSKIANKKNIKQGTLLFFSFPEQDYQMEENVKYNLLFNVAEFAKKRNKKLIIKPHPREKIDNKKFKIFDNVVILDKKGLGENLNYFDYEFIINFFSSIILDILETEYPKNKLLTIGVHQNPSINFGRELKYCSLKKFVAEKHIEI